MRDLDRSTSRFIPCARFRPLATRKWDQLGERVPAIVTRTPYEPPDSVPCGAPTDRAVDRGRIQTEVVGEPRRKLRRLRSSPCIVIDHEDVLICDAAGD